MCGSGHQAKLIVSGFFAVLLCVMVPAASVGSCGAPFCYLGERGPYYMKLAGTDTEPARFVMVTGDDLPGYVVDAHNGSNWVMFYSMLLPQAFSAFMFAYYIVTAFRPADTLDKENLACSIHLTAWAGLFFTAVVIMAPLYHASVGCGATVCYGDGGWGEFFAVLTMQFMSAIALWRGLCWVVGERKKVLAGQAPDRAANPTQN